MLDSAEEHVINLTKDKIEAQKIVYEIQYLNIFIVEKESLTGHEAFTHRDKWDRMMSGNLEPPKRFFKKRKQS